MSAPTVTLPSGDEMPTLGLGTWNIDGDTVRDAVHAGLDAGYTHIDTAEGYMNEAEIGDALAAADADREDLFLTSKVLPKNLDYQSVVEACERSLDRLGTEYLDLYLIHWPNPAISVRETLHAMAHLHDEGLVRNVGVSNFSPYQLRAATHVSDVPIAVNQIEYHPWLQRPDWVEACREEGVVVEAAAPLARAEVFEDEVVRDLAETYDRSPAQVVLRWAIQNDVVVIPKSSTPEHVRGNADVLDWELDAEDVARLDERDRGHAVYDDREKDWESDVWGMAE
ncbi:MAG: aldo/keto reductase [Halobacteriaceae archaeon]